MILLIAIAGTAYAAHSLLTHEANNNGEYDPGQLRGWRIAATVYLVCLITLAVWLAIRGNLM
jgi:hypothetical protein